MVKKKTMKLPHPDKAVIAQSKIVDYLLSLTHPYGRSKARFFIQCGFSSEDWPKLEKALRKHPIEHDVRERIKTPFGVKFIVEGPLNTPKGKTANLRSIWFIETGEEIPQFVTAYPLQWRER